MDSVEAESVEHGSAALAAELKSRAAEFQESTRVRLHRAISWLRRAEREADDPDARFIFLWIAFNAAYAREIEVGETQRSCFTGFFNALVAADTEGRFARILRDQFSGPVRVLIENRYVFAPFWTALRTHDSSERWKDQFDAARRAATKAVVSGDTGTTLSIVFDRLYVLRNQLVHGGATWNSRVNREQIRDGAHLLASLVPEIIAILLDHPELDIGEIMFPVVGVVL